MADVSGSMRAASLGLTALAALLWSPLALGADRVFHEDFESGTTSKWDEAECLLVKSGLDGGGPRSGQSMLQCNWNGTVPWNHADAMTGMVLKSWPYTNEFLLRVWVRLDKDMDSSDGAKLFRLGFGGPDHHTWQRDPATQNGGTHEVWYVNDKLIINGWSCHNHEDRAWHKIEIYIRHDSNGSDGLIKVWFDDVLTKCNQYPFQGDTHTPGAHWYPFNLISNWSSNPGWEHDAGNHTYWDDIEIFSDHGANPNLTGSMVDGTIELIAPPADRGVSLTDRGAGPSEGGARHDARTNGGADAAADAAAADAAPRADAGVRPAADGCSCSVEPTGPALVMPLMLLAVLLWRRRCG